MEIELSLKEIALLKESLKLAIISVSLEEQDDLMVDMIIEKKDEFRRLENKLNMIPAE